MTNTDLIRLILAVKNFEELQRLLKILTKQEKEEFEAAQRERNTDSLGQD